MLVITDENGGTSFKFTWKCDKEKLNDVEAIKKNSESNE
jgi:hypothetical protein